MYDYALLHFTILKVYHKEREKERKREREKERKREREKERKREREKERKREREKERKRKLCSGDGSLKYSELAPFPIENIRPVA